VLITGLGALSSSFPGLISIPQDRVAPVFAFMAMMITQKMRGQATPEQMVQTVLATLALSSLVGGLFYYALGKFKLGDLIRYIPYPVIGGFLAGSGWLLFCGSFRVMTGRAFSLPGLLFFAQPEVVAHWLPGMVFGVVLFLVLRRYTHFLCMPAVLLGGIGLFYAVLAASGVSVAVARDNNWVLQSLPSVHYLELQGLTSLQMADWGKVFLQYGSLAAILLTGTVSILLNTTALELVTEQEMDLNSELRTTGLANMLTGLAGGMMGFVSLSLTRLPLKMGAKGRLTGLVAAAACTLVLWNGTHFLSYVPKFVLGGLLLFLGLGFLVEWVLEGWRRLPRMDYAVVLLIFAVVGTFGYLEGVGVGIFTAAALFVVGYSRVNVISSILTGVELRSNVDRSMTHTRALGEKGNQIFILRLQGFVFFGSANNLLNTVRSRVDNPEQPRLKFVLLDFNRVTGLDSSAALSLLKMRKMAQKQNFILVLTQVTPEILAQLKVGNLDMESDPYIHLFRDRDHGIEWCENRILQEENLLETTSGQALQETLAASWPGTVLFTELIAYMTKQTLPGDDYLMLQGEPSEDLFFLESGQVSVYLELANGRIIRLRTLKEGTVVGEIGFYLKVNRSASIKTECECVVYQLTHDALARMEKENPTLASTFHHFITRLLAERLSVTNRALQTVLE
jgi:SulP family sulfate permease